MNIKSHLSVLIGLANIDNDFADDEKELILMVGKANGIDEEQIEVLLNEPEPLPSLTTMSSDEKLECLYNVVQLMKIDKEIFLSELKYCEDIAIKLGYKKAVIAELSTKIYSNPHITADKDLLKKAILKYQK